MMEKRDWIFVFLIIILGAIVYSNSFGGSFVWDNRYEITQNNDVKNLSIDKIFSGSTTSGAGKQSAFYRPIVTLSFAMDHFIWGLKPAGFHFTNLMIHLISAVILYLIFTSIQPRKIVSFLTALLFVVHPIQVEAVTYISGRSDLLSFFFFILSLFLFIKYLSRTERPRVYYLFSIVCFILAILSKEIYVIAPALFLLVNIVFFKNDAPINKIKKSILNILPFIMLAATYSWLRLTIFKLAGFDSSGNLFSRLLIFIKTIPIYLQMLIWPKDFRFRLEDVYSFASNSQLIFSIIILAAVIYLCLISIRKVPFVLFGFAWFFIALAPVSGIALPINYVLGERWLRLPSVGLFFLASYYIDWISTKLRKHNILKKITLGSFIIYAAFLAITTLRTNNIWKDEITFYSHQLKYYPGDIDNHFNLAAAYKEGGFKKEATEEYKKVIIDLESYLQNPQTNKGQAQLTKIYKQLASLNFELGNIDQSIEYLHKLAMLSPNSWESYSLLGEAYFYKKDYITSLEFFKKALSLDPNNTKIINNIEVVKNTLSK